MLYKCSMTEFLSSLHPKMVHFPVALLFTAGFLELIAMVCRKKFIENAALLLLILGVVSSIAALLTGEQAALQAKELMEVNSPAYKFYLSEIQKHEDSATLVVWIFTFLLLLRGWMFIKITVRRQIVRSSGLIKIISAVLVLTGFYFLYLTGELGGRLVYKHGIGTELFKPADELRDSIGKE